MRSQPRAQVDEVGTLEAMKSGFVPTDGEFKLSTSSVIRGSCWPLPWQLPVEPAGEHAAPAACSNFGSCGGHCHGDSLLNAVTVTSLQFTTSHVVLIMMMVILSTACEW